jgi:hypothetical protein
MGVRLRRGMAAVVLICLAAGAGGCAGGGGYQDGRSPGPYLSDVPSSFYNDDPTLRHWYTAPYWNPDASP